MKILANVGPNREPMALPSTWRHNILLKLNSTPSVATFVNDVDDCFIISNSEKVSSLLFDKLNSIHNSIKFTKEIEINNQLSFLDVLIKRKDDKFITSVFRKPTFTGQYLNFLSYCSKRRKIGSTKTLFHRASKICSPEVFSDRT